MAGWAIEWKSPVKAAGRWPAWPLLIFFELQFEGSGSRHNGSSKRITARFPISSSLESDVLHTAAHHLAKPQFLRSSIPRALAPNCRGSEGSPNNCHGAGPIQQITKCQSD